jgi:hypothetical protein
MSSDYFERIADSVNLPLMQRSLVVVVGIGTVGSQIAMELARCGIGRFRLIDGDHFEEANRPRHVLPQAYVGMNKAAAMTLYLDDEVPGSLPEAVPRYVNNTLPDASLDRLLQDANLIVAATDDRNAQRRVGRRALALDTPAIFPALYSNSGGEVVVQLDSRLPCFFCWDGFRDNEEQLRGVTALNMDAQPVIHRAIQLSLGILDPHSEQRRLIVGEPNQPLRQLFMERALGGLQMGPLTRRPGCPSCAVGPAPMRRLPGEGAPREMTPQEQIAALKARLANQGAAGAGPTIRPPTGERMRPVRPTPLQPTPQVEWSAPEIALPRSVGKTIAEACAFVFAYGIMIAAGIFLVVVLFLMVFAHHSG